MDKNIVVLREYETWNRRYQCLQPRRRKYYAHDPHNDCEIGDVVRIRPLGKRREGTKQITYELERIVRRDPGMAFAERVAQVLPSIRKARSEGGEGEGEGAGGGRGGQVRRQAYRMARRGICGVAYAGGYAGTEEGGRTPVADIAQGLSSGGYGIPIPS